MTLGEVTRASRPELQADEAPVGVGEVADDFPHGRWLFLDQTEIHRDWNARYVWPKFVTAVPTDFFEAVRTDAAGTGAWITPQSRDMNPIYTGKDVSYIDTKQAQRAAEVACLDGERLATLAWLAGALYPAEVDRQGVAPDCLRRPSRRDHRHRGQPGLSRSAARLAGGLGTRRRGPRRQLTCGRPGRAAW